MTKSPALRLLFISAFVLISTIAVYFRVSKPEIDAPFDICFCQSENIDWTWYMSDALAKEHLAAPDPSCDVYNHPFFTEYQRLIFKAFGLSPTSLTYSSLLPGLLTVLLLGLVLFAVSRSPTQALIAMLLASTNFILIEYSRIPGVYSWITAFEFIFVLLWVIPTKNAKLALGLRIFSVLLLLFLAVTLKNTILLYLPPLILTQLIYQRPSKRTFTVTALSTLAVSFAGGLIFHRAFIDLVVMIWSTFKDRIIINLGKFTVGQVLNSIFMQLVHFQFHFMLLVAFAAFVGAFWIICRLYKKAAVPFLDIYATLCYFVGFFFYVIQTYHPVRYFLFLTPTMIYLSVRLIAGLVELVNDRWPDLAKTWRVPFGIGISLALIYIIYGNLNPLMIWRTKQYRTFIESREDFNELLPRDAVAAGPYSELLSYNNPFPAYRLHSSQINVTKPRIIVPEGTHAIMDTGYNLNYSHDRLRSQWLFLSELYLRGYEVAVFRLPNMTRTSRSLFEEGAFALREGNEEAAKRYWHASMEKFPNSGASARALLLLALHDHDGAATRELVEIARQRNPSHPLPWFILCHLGRQEHNIALQQVACQKLLETSFNTKGYAQKMDQKIKNGWPLGE